MLGNSPSGLSFSKGKNYGEVRRPENSPSTASLLPHATEGLPFSPPDIFFANPDACEEKTNNNCPGIGSLHGTRVSPAPESSLNVKVREYQSVCLR